MHRAPALRHFMKRGTFQGFSFGPLVIVGPYSPSRDLNCGPRFEGSLGLRLATRGPWHLLWMHGGV